MLPTISCPHCGMLLKSSSPPAPGKKVICVSCQKAFLVHALDALLDRQCMMRMGDDDGGGDWGGGSSEADSAKDDDDDDDEEDEDGKKKKKKKQGFFAGLMSTMLGKLISAAVTGVVLISCCCCVGVGSWFGLFPGSPPYVGEFESISKVKIQIEEDGKEVDVEEIEVKLKISGAEGTGTYTDGKTGDELTFKLKNHDKEKKTVVFELDNPQKTFWRDLKSPTTFEYEGKDKTLTLTSKSGPASVLTLTRIEPAPKARPAKKRRR